MNRRFLLAMFVVVSVGLTGFAVWARNSAGQSFVREAEKSRALAEQIRRNTVVFTERTVPAGTVFSTALGRLGVDASAASAIELSTRGVYDLRRVRAGNQLAVGRSLDGELRAVRYQIDPEQTLLVAAAPDRPGEFHAEVKLVPATLETVGVTGVIHGALFDAITEAGEGPELALLLADIFGWDIDFHTDPRRGDTFRVAVEKKTYANGAVRYTQILAAEYVNEGRAYRAVLFRNAAGKIAHYAPDGASVQKAFLRSPLKFGAPVTSRFSGSRFHPVLKRHRPHLGVDYGAPYGAPVQAIGDGRVLFAGARGANGRMVHLRHTNGYETMYLHLSRILVHAGQHVSQGQLLGQVGSTGLATGPHLDFRITQHGAYRNFETLRLPPAQPVAKRDWDDFVAQRDAHMALLPDLRRAPTTTAP